MKNVYFISGLGADKRVFSLLDLSFCNPVFIDWIPPLSHESLTNYALRLKGKITEPYPTIVGISFGGMLVTEMAKDDKAVKAIIVSSAKTSGEIPFYYKVGKYVPAYKWIPMSLYHWLMKRFYWILGGKNKEEKELLNNILSATDINFTKWAIHSILHWKNKKVSSNIIHIHGTSDKLLPLRFVKASHLIKGGTHVMTLDNQEEVSDLLKHLLKSDN